MARQVDEALREGGNCVEGDAVVIVAGSPPGIPGSTNSLSVHHVGDAKRSWWAAIVSESVQLPTEAAGPLAD